VSIPVAAVKGAPVVRSAYQTDLQNRPRYKASFSSRTGSDIDIAVAERTSEKRQQIELVVDAGL
jgi:hypothetical protein